MAAALALLLIVGIGAFSQTAESQNASIAVLSQLGTRGQEVRAIQTKLKSLGFYTGAVDGIFGVLTKAAVLRCQKKKGLLADGIVGPKTRGALKKAVK